MENLTKSESKKGSLKDAVFKRFLNDREKIVRNVHLTNDLYKKLRTAEEAKQTEQVSLIKEMIKLARSTRPNLTDNNTKTTDLEPIQSKDKFETFIDSIYNNIKVKVDFPYTPLEVINFMNTQLSRITASGLSNYRVYLIINLVFSYKPDLEEMDKQYTNYGNKVRGDTLGPFHKFVRSFLQTSLNVTKLTPMKIRKTLLILMPSKQ